VIGGERERRSAAPGSLIVPVLVSHQPTNKILLGSPHFVKGLERKIYKLFANICKMHIVV
jgi:hypothetical protein